MELLVGTTGWLRHAAVSGVEAEHTNRGGLVVRARLDRRRYPTGKRVSKKELRELKIERDDFHGDWNYVIRPRTKMPSPTDSPIRGP